MAEVIDEKNKHLACEELCSTEILKNKKRIEAECDAFEKNIEMLDVMVRKFEVEKLAKENQMRLLADENQKQEGTLNKLNQERKHQEEVAKKIIKDWKAEEDLNAQEKALLQKLEQNLKVF